MTSVTPLQPNKASANDHDCKGCSASVHVSEDAIARLVSEMAQDEAVALTGEEDYARRMQACQRCDSLQFGTTCRWCGCLVAVKAKKAEAKCPHPKGSQW